MEYTNGWSDVRLDMLGLSNYLRFRKDPITMSKKKSGIVCGGFHLLGHRELA